jgi:hypothetical protein
MRLPAPRRANRLRAVAVLWTALLPACDRARSESEPRDQSPHEPLIQLRVDGAGRATGSVFDDRDFRLEVGTPRVCNETAPFLPEPGQIRVSIPVEVRAKTRRLIPTSPLSFQLTDHQGRKYGPTLAGCQPALKNIRLGEGQSIEGDVAFDVAVNARDLELGFEPFLIGRSEVHALVRVPTEPSPREPPPNEHGPDEQGESKQGAPASAPQLTAQED